MDTAVVSGAEVGVVSEEAEEVASEAAAGMEAGSAVVLGEEMAAVEEDLEVEVVAGSAEEPEVASVEEPVVVVDSHEAGLLINYYRRIAFCINKSYINAGR